MITKEELSKAIDIVINGVRTPPTVMNFLPGLPITRRRFADLLQHCVELQKDIYLISDSDPSIFDLHARFLALEAEYKRLRAKLMLLPSFTIIYFGFIALFALLNFIDVTGFIKSVLKVEAPERLLTLGVAGAFLYLATSMLSRIAGASDPMSKVIDFTIRLTLAIVVPIVLVALFFTPDGKLSEMRVSPELMAFACGYSAKLVVEIFNKIVEKVSKMIEAI